MTLKAVERPLIPPEPTQHIFEGEVSLTGDLGQWSVYLQRDRNNEWEAASFYHACEDMTGALTFEYKERLINAALAAAADENNFVECERV